MKKMSCLVLALLFSVVCVFALAQDAAMKEAAALIPENYPFFYVMDIRQAQTEEPPVVIVSGCFGDFGMDGHDDESGLEVFGFDKLNPIELRLSDSCEVLLPVDFIDNILTNLPCADILEWYARDYEGFDEPPTFYCSVTIDESGLVTKLEYQYFPWG